jgi:hypothetical protein
MIISKEGTKNLKDWRQEKRYFTGEKGKDKWSVEN